MSSRIDAVTPLVFSIAPDAPEPPGFFGQILDHLGVDQRRILLVRHPTRFSELLVTPQAERRFGGRPTRRHLRMMDGLTSGRPPSPCGNRASFSSACQIRIRLRLRCRNRPAFGSFEKRNFY